eukprot:TRINITY_DN1287_c1_g2_i2.p1 TRINITY_DN1287_c1_g2~~TRINITY_DN1287_c1_g2_i2.p1  ORF type:complete len:1018 (-),score=347.27 TRINITY_DN1287_c1_g2_i2:671-3724(-)
MDYTWDSDASLGETVEFDKTIRIKDLELVIIETSKTNLKPIKESLEKVEKSEDEEIRRLQEQEVICTTLTEQFINGQYTDILDSDIAKELSNIINEKEIGEKSPLDFMDSCLNELMAKSFDQEDMEMITAEEVPDEEEGSMPLYRGYQCMLIGAACMNMYQQANMTGPPLNKDILNETAFIKAFKTKFDEKTITKALEYDGETFYTLAVSPELLLSARGILRALAPPKQNTVRKDDATFTATTIRPLAALPLITRNVSNAVGSMLTTSNWWAGRAATANQRSMNNDWKHPSATLWAEASANYRIARVEHGRLEAIGSDNHRAYLAGRLWLEWGYCQNCFLDEDGAKVSFQKAKSASGLEAEMTGIMGRKTRYQTESRAQLVLKAKSKQDTVLAEESMHTSHKEHEKKMADKAAKKLVPQSATMRAKMGIDEEGKPLTQEKPVVADIPEEKDEEGEEESESEEDEHELQKYQAPSNKIGVKEIGLKEIDRMNPLLEQIHFDKEQEDVVLSMIDQAIILALCLDIKNNNPKHGLTQEQMLPYVAKVTEMAKNWMIHADGLRTKAIIEFEKKHSLERGVLQLQALVDQQTDRLTVMQPRQAMIDDAAPVQDRLEFIYSLGFPYAWNLSRSLADRYLKMGVVKSALAIYEELNMWDDVVVCYRILEKTEKAEDIVLKQIEEHGETAPLLCTLADIRGDMDLYLKSWEVSGQRYAKAMRGLADLEFDLGKLTDARDHMRKALTINGMFPGKWFKLGTICMRIQDWEGGLHAFSRTLQLEPQEGEAWANASSILMTVGNYEQAYTTLQYALKYKRSSWQLWSNYQYAAFNVKQYQQVIRATNKLIDLREYSESELMDVLDLKVLLNLVSVTCDESAVDCYDRKMSVHLEPVRILIDRCCSKLPSQPEVWRLAARLALHQKDIQKAYDYTFKWCRQEKNSDWKISSDSHTLLASACRALLEICISQNLPVTGDRSITAVRDFVAVSIRQIPEEYRNGKGYDLLQKIIEDADSAMNGSGPRQTAA